MIPPTIPPAAAPPAALRPRVKVWFETEGGFSFGSGLIAILEAVAREGSIKQAAGTLGQSYRHVWGRIKQAEQAIGSPLVEAHIGGQGTQRSGLTETARNLVAEFVVIRARMVAVMEEEAARRREVRPSSDPPPSASA